MALYEYTITYQVIETPLNESPLKITKADLPPEPVQMDIRQRMMWTLAIVLLVVVLGGAMLAPRTQVADLTEESGLAASEAAQTAVTHPQTLDTAVAPVASGISPIFAPPVQHWAPKILEWSAAHGLDPNITATIMQIESCGDPQALSHAGATSLFQVMPFHFEPGENAFDPDTNALRGLSFYVYVLDLTNGDVGRALAGYNGGPRAALNGWDSWVSETRRYYTWGTGIYEDASAGLTESPTLQEWMAAGGASLCQQAANRLGLN